MFLIVIFYIHLNLVEVTSNKSTEFSVDEAAWATMACISHINVLLAYTLLLPELLLPLL